MVEVYGFALSAEPFEAANGLINAKFPHTCLIKAA
jgi:hypothetical protein